MKRRSFLQKGLAGGAVLLLGGGGLALQPTRRLAEPPPGLQVFDARGFQVMVAVAARILPFEGVDHAALAARADAYLALASPEVGADMAKVVGLFENALPGFLLDGRVRPFTQMGPEAQDRVLEAWRTSSLVLRRGVYQALRKVCLACWYGESAAWRPLHYPGPPSLGGLFYDDSKAGAVDPPKPGSGTP